MNAETENAAAVCTDEKALELFRAFVQNLDDVDEEPEYPGDVDWQNRLGWAWDRLADFAERLGPEFVKAANINGRLIYRE